MRVYLGSDHAGFALKNYLARALAERGHDVVDCGPAAYVATDDYPPYCIDAARRTVADPGSLGVVIGGSGNGEQIAANKVGGCRAALVYDPEIARLARRHNDAQVAGIGARMHTEERALELVEAFLGTEFEGGRHARRVEMLADYERTGVVPTTDT